MPAAASTALGLLLDIDGVLYVGDQPIEGAHAALRELRELTAGVRLVTNTTSRSRREVTEHLRELGFEVAPEEVLTPAAMAVRLCRERGYRSVAALVGEGLREDLAELEPTPLGEGTEAIVLGDLGEGFTPARAQRGVQGDDGRRPARGAPAQPLLAARRWPRPRCRRVGGRARVRQRPRGDRGRQARGRVLRFGDRRHRLRAGGDGGRRRRSGRGRRARRGPRRECSCARASSARTRSTASGVAPSAIVDSIAQVPGLLARPDALAV